MDARLKNRPPQSSSFFHNAKDFNVGNLNQTNIGHDQYNIAQQINVGSPRAMGLLSDLLNPVPDASHARNRKVSPPYSSCLPGTRQEIIQKITTWADSSVIRNNPHVMWLYGYVGCGKSSIAQAIAERYAVKKRLAASFFFFRGGGDRRRSAKFAATVASQIAGAIPSASRFIEANIKAHSGLLHPSASVTAQFQHLVYEPIESAKWDMMGANILRGPYLMVIDGLDECEDMDDISSFIDQMLDFFRKNPRIPLRILITSRVEEHIRTRLDPNQVELVNLVDHTSLNDIAIAFRAIFALAAKHSRTIQSYGAWPAPSDLQQLVKHTGCSFIFMATIAKFILDPSNDGLNPMRRLPLALEINPGLDGLYGQTLQQGEHLPHFLYIIWTIALVERPLSIRELADLLGIQKFEVIEVLVKLHSILQVPGDDTTNVTLCHSSLHDFITTQSRSGRFYAPLSFHEELAYRSMHLLGPRNYSGDSRPAYEYAEGSWMFHWRRFSQTIRSKGERSHHTKSLISHLRDSHHPYCELVLAAYVPIDPGLPLDPEPSTHDTTLVELLQDRVPPKFSKVIIEAISILRDRGSFDESGELQSIWEAVNPPLPALSTFSFDLVAIGAHRLLNREFSNVSDPWPTYLYTIEAKTGFSVFSWCLLSWPQHLARALQHEPLQSQPGVLHWKIVPSSGLRDDPGSLSRILGYLCRQQFREQRRRFIASVKLAANLAAERQVLRYLPSAKRPWNWSGKSAEPRWLESQYEEGEIMSLWDLLDAYLQLVECLEGTCTHDLCPVASSAKEASSPIVQD
ncbi:hypothetical protein D9611_008936 [Ephemerocybe angulata]|uniref:Nephrocystin 3-like N-terminal domain-containing protein n=1 Tax=Ephemerocybe angulata TaxID=980116 RepID=A0A8H5C0V0_9AGAR|nr:hypothetical protein D9611_008936 [Tulosesus angulatus]